MTTTRRDFLAATAAAGLGASITPRIPDLSRPDHAWSSPTGVQRARAVPLERVRVTGGPLKRAQDLTGKYLLSLEPDRMIAFYRVRASLPKKAEPYGGWDGPGKNLTGHIAGHYLSAVSLMYAATGDGRFKDRANYIVRELKEVQDKHGDGYLSALENGREAFAAVSKGDIRPGAFDLNGLWSPWYVLHKTFAGLRDAYRHTGNREALDVEGKFASWAERVLAPLSEQQMQRMLLTEHGGMNEVLADLYADTHDRRWLALSLRFEHHALTDALKRHQDNLSGKHGNCQIPKLIGSAARYEYTADPDDLLASSFFWDRVAQHHSYVTGGDGLAEYFGPPDVFAGRADGRTCETCNVYNMIKLTRRLFSFRPDAIYADFHERALFNHILASIDPEDGRVSYMVPVGRGVQQEYQDPLRDFTCCCGTGMESHALHGHGVYYESDDTIWVNLFVPSTAQFTLAGAGIAMESGFPDGDSARLTVTVKSPKEFSIAVRRPAWAGDGFAITVNGQKIEQPPLATFRVGGAGGRGNAPGNEAELQLSSSYVQLKRVWHTGDTIALTLPKSVRLEPAPDNKQVAALMWGPLVLAADWGPRREGGRGTPPPPPVPSLVAGGRPVGDWVVAASVVGDFRAPGVARVPGLAAPAADVTLAPFHRTHRRRYSVYLDVLTQAEFDSRNKPG